MSMFPLKKPKKFIQKIGLKHGQLHKDLAVPMDKKIPHEMLVEAAKRKDKIGQRARFALSLEKMGGKK